MFEKYKGDGPVEAAKQSFAIFQKWDSVKRKLALFLQQKSELLSTRMKQLLLAMFCMVFCGISVRIAFHESLGKGQAVQAIAPYPKMPQPEKVPLRPDSIITKGEFQKVQSFKAYLLMLQNDSINTVKFDSIIKLHPHLLDSIAAYEKIYLSQ